MSLVFGLPANVIYATAGIYALLVFATIGCYACALPASATGSWPRESTPGGG
jgi:hypothetical protein